MKYLLTLFSILMISSLSAETIGSVEYHLPNTTLPWELSNKLENKATITLIYTPKGVRKEKAKDFFAVVDTPRYIDINDTLALEAEFKLDYPNKNVDFRVLEKNKNSIIYELLVSQNDQETIYAIGRIIETKVGHVEFLFMTYHISDRDTVKSTWLPVLKEARIIP